MARVAFVLALSWVAVLFAACTSASTKSSTTTIGSGLPSASRWSPAIVAKAQGACEKGGGTPSGCACAVSYLESHGYLTAGPAERQGMMQDATAACGETSSTTTSSPSPTTTLSTYTCQITLGTPSGTNLVSTGDDVTAYVESTDRDAAVNGAITFTGNGNLPNNDVPITNYGPSSTDSGGRADYSFQIDPRDLVGAQMLVSVTIGGATCTAGATVS